jgi:hypothetical protein
MFDFILESPETISALTPMERRADVCNVFAIQLTIQAELSKAQPDAGLSPEQIDGLLAFAAEITQSAEA